MVDSGQKLQVAVVHSNGRRGFDPLSKERLLAACLEPGASVSRLALENGVNVNLVWKWLRKYRATKKEAFPITPFPPAFIPVQIKGEARRSGGYRSVLSFRIWLCLAVKSRGRNLRLALYPLQPR